MQLIPISRRTVIAFAAVSLAAMLPASLALAHAEFKSSTPAPNAVLATSPAGVTITFIEDITLKFSGASVTGPDKAAVRTGPAALDPKNHAVLIIPIVDALTTGRYTVEWHNLSTDGHRLQGSFTFSVK